MNHVIGIAISHLGESFRFINFKTNNKPIKCEQYYYEILKNNKYYIVRIDIIFSKPKDIVITIYKESDENNDKIREQLLSLITKFSAKFPIRR